jgi:EAL domain-containing protein (putative c-di-GMP-specific phosphodiesterase class I)
VLRQSCEAFRPHLANPECPYLGVNISVSDIYTGDLPNRLAEILKETGMPASRLILEVTEDMLLHDENSAIEVLAQIRSQGVRIAIDDFGTGYSSMGYLSKYQVHLIKIDRSFVQNIATSSQDQKIVRAISSMARDLELSIITEVWKPPNNPICSGKWGACCSKVICLASHCRPHNGR